MILCVEKDKLKTSPEVQRKADIVDIVENCTEYFDTAEDALNSNYVPLDFSVSIRSLYSNLVVQATKTNDDGSIKKMMYTNLANIDRFQHKGADLIMYLSSIGVMYNIDYKYGFDEVMLKHSQFSPIGIYNPNPDIINPIVYTHILISDEGAEELKKFLKTDREFVPISSLSIPEVQKYNIHALLDTFIEVKPDDKNGGETNE